MAGNHSGAVQAPPLRADAYIWSRDQVDLIGCVSRLGMFATFYPMFDLDPTDQVCSQDVLCVIDRPYNCNP